MELHFIILIALSAILLLFIILAICAYCCGDLCCNCGNSSYSHSRSRESYRNETVTTGTKTSSKGEYHRDQYFNNDLVLPSLMPTRQTDFEVDESHSTPLLTKYPPQPLGFGYPDEATQEEITEIPQPDRNYYPPDTVSYPVSERAPYPVSERAPYQQNSKKSHHIETISYTTHPSNKVAEANGLQYFASTPLPNQNNSYSSTQINQTTVAPYRGPGNIETVQHAKSVSHDMSQPSKQIYTGAIEANSYQPTKHSETHQYSRTMTLPAKQRMPYQQDPEIIYHVETDSYAPYSPVQRNYSSNTETSHFVGDSYRYSPTKNDLQQTETMYFTRPGSCPPSNETPTRNVYASDPYRNKTHSTRTVTYSTENISPYPVSMRVANSVELLPSLDNQAQIGKSPFKKQPSQVSLYDNM